MDGVGAVVIVDELNHRVVRWLPGAEQGKVIAGGNGEGCGLGQLYLPRACALDGEGGLFIADTGNNRIVYWAQDAQQGSVIAGDRTGPEDPEGEESKVYWLDQPIGVQLTRAGALVITELHRGRIVHWFPGSDRGEAVICGAGLFGGTRHIFSPSAAMLDDDGSFVIAVGDRVRFLRWYDFKEGKCLRKNFERGTLLWGHGDAGIGGRRFHYPSPFQRGPTQERMIVAVEGDGAPQGVRSRGWRTPIYLAMEGNRVVRCSQGAEEVCVIAGGPVDSRGRIQLGRPTAVALSRDGAVIIADGENHCILCLSEGAGQGTVIAGGNGAGRV